jgi:uncharacterized RmlC-like cupin family protein
VLLPSIRHQGVACARGPRGTRGGTEHALEAGDAIYFDSTVPHAYRRSSGRKCSAIVVTAA